MQNKLIDDINNYISYLNSNGLYVSVHGKNISGLLEHNMHRNPYCAFVKTDNDAWKRCVKCQQKLFSKHNEDYIFGMCYAGIEEYVFYVNDNTFICVSGYGINKEKAKERINNLANNYYFDKNELLRIYNRGLKHKEENIDNLKILIKPLCHMLSLLQITYTSNLITDSKNKTFDSILAYIQRNIMQDISLKNIAGACSCSESTVSHLFKEYTNQSVKKYINNIRIKEAEKMLITTDLSISTIAAYCGFSDTNYFSSCFKKYFNMSPTQYRKKV